MQLRAQNICCFTNAGTFSSSSQPSCLLPSSTLSSALSQGATARPCHPHARSAPQTSGSGPTALELQPEAFPL